MAIYTRFITTSLHLRLEKLSSRPKVLTSYKFNQCKPIITLDYKLKLKSRFRLLTPQTKRRRPESNKPINSRNSTVTKVHLKVILGNETLTECYATSTSAIQPNTVIRVHTEEEREKNRSMLKLQKTLCQKCDICALVKDTLGPRNELELPFGMSYWGLLCYPLACKLIALARYSDGERVTPRVEGCWWIKKTIKEQGVLRECHEYEFSSGEYEGPLKAEDEFGLKLGEGMVMGYDYQGQANVGGGISKNRLGYEMLEI
ncbi:hypothetical protein SBOR_3556 [Sclerotinia borealis F-4128]|uniref:Uncharacterized protein n=1 Tax=Sclerotinia borealis (strain F-4128) TaxID=1432307 RepID=W9CN49_SCLBF|nr:hypothetical protein SBOR_3556 [Sclerotinia borealis F-4128]